VLIGVVMPKRRAMSATVPKPTSLPQLRRDGVDRIGEGGAHVDLAGIGAALLRGLQPSIVTGSSTTRSSGL
jgi:hypothetical protein